MFLSERLQLFSYLLSTMKDLYIKSISICQWAVLSEVLSLKSISICRKERQWEMLQKEALVSSGSYKNLMELGKKIRTLCLKTSNESYCSRGSSGSRETALALSIESLPNKSCQDRGRSQQHWSRQHHQGVPRPRSTVNINNDGGRSIDIGNYHY